MSALQRLHYAPEASMDGPKLLKWSLMSKIVLWTFRIFKISAYTYPSLDFFIVKTTISIIEIENLNIQSKHVKVIDRNDVM